ncbi:Ataxin 2-like [Mactra antiquata]
MMNNKRTRGGGRMNPSAGRPDKRQIYSQERQQRARGPIDKTVQIEGLYKNHRLTHVMFAMVGCVVQVQVKNGIIYEGILRTTSSSGDTVLECAHMVEDNGGSPVSSTPSKDRILSKLIIKNTDLVTLTAPSIDLDYAVKDSFTDAGIAKYNGEMKDKEMRELTPWESEEGYDITLDEGDKSSNGWDANDMFYTNAEKFNVQSSYDESLGQYTTKLERGNSEEYRRREQEAFKLAAEIERCDTYKKNIAMENGEGGDEEAAFSAVVRPGESSSHVQPTGTGGPGKYQPPFKRQPGSGGVVKSRGGFTSQTNRNITSQQHQSAPVTQVSSQSTVENMNGDEASRQSIPVSTAGPTVKTSPTVHEHVTSSQTEKIEHTSQHIPHYDGKKPTKGRDEQIKELKAFSTNFKLDDNKDNTKDKDKEIKDNSEKSIVERKDSVSEEKDLGSEKVVSASSSSENKENTQPVVTAVPVTVSQQEKNVVSEERHAETVTSTSSAPSQDTVPNLAKSKLNPEAKEFSLNPEAKEFVPGNLSFQMSVQQQTPSPHRPQTQSPVVLAPQMTQPIYPNTSQQHFMIPPAHQMVLNPPAAVAAAAASQPPYKVQPKRAVVSVKPDYPPSAVQAATGQPLLAQSANAGGYMLLPHNVMPPQPTGYQIGQVMPMPGAQASGQRYMTPTSVQGVPSSMPHGSAMDRNNPALQASQVYMTTPNQPGPMPAHLSHASHFTHNNHIIMSNPNSQQQQQQSSQMNAPPSGAGGHHHPAPSPVHTNPNPQSMNPGPHPPSSGTPQPPQGYAQPNMPTHPPLQQSPHNPTSPQNMQPIYPYPSSGHPMQMQGSAGGQQFSSVPQHSSVPTSGTFSMQAHHSPHMQPQYVMMPPSGQINHPHIQSSHQFQGHQIPGKFTGSMQPQLMSQSGVQGLPGQNPGQGPHPPHQLQHFPLQGLAAITSALHARPEHFIVQHVRK